MTKSDLAIVQETMKTLNQMCNVNHDYCKTINNEFIKFVEIVKTIDARLKKLEDLNNA
jgi:hypothetical protein